ncbi:hypothetical protein ABB37_00907 [Leptomonas pyrrhocoris]|uniref:Uncharacterized protein n=1 Tax=Leptomonas pyrrhocoris TaxID=157538 RepID=A0A0M9GB99_LEPPY|nr:hypothetical protein ABB37_00907 [Leptomonas pyrrhocoris]XP_015665299.1 hypothetical protein ABB37_00907 [Leptomonas pyrrhocoris]KPA86859.1 hypothetical protein ABB37_00907 [Leptomonas pyrrhocoris]KPA86860.1 hypothetical protein ABB37_00907 [Leptomonas pyrrhocoris]|eukprot:XP_015665298.1 hypothetical protein ABB37_00907 [Leptomonas pyrrhocoris]
MATPENGNIYDTLGTVLYTTVPVVSAADAAPAQDLADAQNIPLDYETAIAMLEAAHAHVFQNSVLGKSTASATAAGVLSGGAAQAAAGVRASSAAADGHLQPGGSSYGKSSMVPTPPQQRGGPSNVSARYGPYGSTQRGGAGGGASLGQPSQTSKSGSSGVGGPPKGDSRSVGYGEGGAAALDSVAAHNTAVATAVTARLSAKEASSSKKALSGVKGTSTTTAAAASLDGGPRAGDRVLTAAGAMEMLFPIAPVAAAAAAADGTGEGGGNTDSVGHERGRPMSTSSATAAHGKQSKGDGAALTQAGGDASSTAAANKTLPRLWRRADVGHVSRLDVVLLYLHLQRRCATESARPCGVVCPNRERLYSDVLQELTRQITLLCPERGLLLDELSRGMQQSIETYDVLLDNASQYAVRKSTERDLHQHLFAEKAELETEVRRREHRVSEWRAKYAGLQKRLEEQQAADDKLHEQEIAYAKKANTQLVNEIKRLASEAEKAKEN